jgi:glycosyltransferase involved in cell wall biosynthesis
MSAPLRILYVSPSATLGGAERSLLELIAGLPRERYRSFLMLPREGPLVAAGHDAGATVVVVPWPAGLLTIGREKTWSNLLRPLAAPLLLPPVLARIARQVRRLGIDIIHTNGTKAHLAASPAALLLRRPMVWHLRDILGPGPLLATMRSLARWLPDAIIANSRATAASMGERLTPAPRVIYNGLDMTRFAPRPRDPAVRHGLGIPADAFAIGAFGALAPLKGHIWLIRAMPAVLAAAPEAHLVILGEEMYDTSGHRGYRAVLEEEVARLGLAGRVVLPGRRDDVVRHYAAMDVVVNSSVRPESFGRVLVEAMACGCPVVSTDLGGPREILEDPGTGTLVPAEDPAALTAAILALHADPARRRRMGDNGRAMVAERFAIERHVAQVCRLYEELAESGARGGRRGAAVDEAG